MHLIIPKWQLRIWHGYKTIQFQNKCCYFIHKNNPKKNTMGSILKNIKEHIYFQIANEEMFHQINILEWISEG